MSPNLFLSIRYQEHALLWLPTFQAIIKLNGLNNWKFFIRFKKCAKAINVVHKSSINCSFVISQSRRILLSKPGPITSPEWTGTTVQRRRHALENDDFLESYQP